MTNEAELVSLMRELVLWTKVGNLKTVKGVLEQVLSDDKKLLAYQLADGTRTSEEIRKAVATSPNTISRLFKDCESLGLMRTDHKGKRIREFDLNIFGLMPEKSDDGNGGKSDD